MKHLVGRPQVCSFLRILPFRFSIFRFPKTVPSLRDFRGDRLLLSLQAALRERFKNTEPGETCVRMELQRERFSELRSIYYKLDKGGENIESQGVPVDKVLASYILISTPMRTEMFFNQLESKGTEGIALAMLRRSERSLLDEDLFGPSVYLNLIAIYRHRGDKEDIHRVWSLAKDMKLCNVQLYSLTLLAFLLKKDIQGAHEVLEDWESSGINYVQIRNALVFDSYRKRVLKHAEKMINEMLEEYDEEDGEKKKRAMEVRRNGWDPEKNFALSAYACAQYVDGRIDIDSAADVLRLLGTQEPQDDMNRDVD